MIYKTYDCKSYKVHTVKTDKFKTCHIEIIFSRNLDKKTLVYNTFLADMLSDSSSIYPTNRDLLLHLEDLYKTIYYANVVKLGNMDHLTINVDFIDPSYIDEESYLENVIKLPFDMLLNPNQTNNEFNITSFNIVKERLKKEIESINDFPMKKALTEALKEMDKDSVSSISIKDCKDIIDSITPSNLYKFYQNIFKENTCDIFIIGSLDMDKVVSLIKKYFKNRIISNINKDYYVINKTKKKPSIKKENSDNIQTNLVLVCNVENLNDYEKNIVMPVFNYIFGSGGLTSKLYKSVREENSLCYSINSMYLKYDNLLLITTSLNEENVNKALVLIKKCLKDMIKGNILDEDLKDALNNINLSLNLSLDNPVSILNNYELTILDNLPSIEERKELIKKVNKEDIMKLAKKIKLNTIYSLVGGNNEGN